MAVCDIAYFEFLMLELKPGIAWLLPIINHSEFETTSLATASTSSFHFYSTPLGC